MAKTKGPETERRPYIGGQAVIEGVMMRSPRSFAIAVRRRSGAMSVRERPMFDSRKGVLAWPFVRGVAALVEALRLGSQALRFSSELYERDLEEAEEKEKAAAATKAKAPGVMNTLAAWMVAIATLDDEPAAKPKVQQRSAGSGAFTWISLIVAMAIFVALPQATAYGASRILHITPDIRSFGFQALTGLFKLCIVVGYMAAIRKIPEIHRVFQFHGAEHKTIATWEAEQDLTVDNARGKSRLHPRCGTAFLVLVVLVSVLVFTAIGPLLPQLPVGGAALENVLFFLMKLPFLPVIAAITFELQRLSARYCLTGPLRVFLYPGFAVQMITTIEPDDSQLEVALASLRATLWRESAEQAPAEPEDQQFASYAELVASPGYVPTPAISSTAEHAAS